jgi:hypothetical protein
MMVDSNGYRQQLRETIGDCAAESGDREGLQHFEHRGNKDEPPRRENQRLGVAVCVNAGAALVYSTRVMDTYELNPAAAGAATKRPNRSLTTSPTDSATKQ